MLRSRRLSSTRDFRRHGVTIVEFLVVAFVIVLLVLVLLPSSRSSTPYSNVTLCMSRIAQLTKAMTMYAEDYDGVPPFILRDAVADDPFSDGGANRRKETWLAAAATMQRIYLLPEDDWYTEPGRRVIESGTLYPYARFANLYVCPEFQKLHHADKHQGAFNFTRNIMGRKASPERIGRFDGEILKIEAVAEPSALPMLFDEAWDAHVARPDVSANGWCGIDPVADVMRSCLGQYHGQPTVSRWRSADKGTRGATAANYVKRASVGCYDGHAELMRDPCPGRAYQNGGALLDPMNPESGDFLAWFSTMFKAQSGTVPQLEPSPIRSR
jgi:competence protein ComGC